MKRITNITLLAFLLLLFGSALSAQTTASFSVKVVSPEGIAIPGARLTLSNPLTGFQKQGTADEDGRFELSQIPTQNYRLAIEAQGFQPETREVSLRSNVPVHMEVVLRLSSVVSSIEVTASADAALVDPEATGSRAALSAMALEKIRVPVGNRGLEAYLLTLPGFAVNANGAIHPRGAHNQMTYVIDGLPISDQLTGAFATSLDPAIVDSLELYTGDVPAEFGSKVSGVAAVSTRGGVGAGRVFTGSGELANGQFNTLQGALQAGGERGRFAYFASLSGVKTHRFLDAVSLDNLHNAGNAQRTFLRLDYQLTDRDTLRFSAMAGRSSFQLANLRSQHAVGMDQRQVLRDASFWVRWNRVLSATSSWESTVAYRPTVAQLFPSAGDTPVTAAQARHLTTITIANRLNWSRGRHNLRSGIDVQRFPVSEAFSVGITDPAFNHPNSPRFNDSLLAHDLTRGGSLFRFSRKQAGSLYSTFLQDVIRAGRFTVSLGARYDNYRFLVVGAQFQPRIGVAFHLRETGTVLRASYNRNYQTPPNENLLLSNSEEASRLAPAAVRQALGETFVPIRPQRENVYEAGIQQALFGRASLNASVYHKNSLDQQDNDNFLNTGIIFPLTLARIRVNGAEARLTLPTIHNLTATLSATHARAISTPPFTGGLFLGQTAVDALSSGPFLIDHDQKLSLQSNLNYAPHPNWWINSSVRYDSGLVSNPSDPAAVAKDPDYADLLPYVNLTSSVPRVRPRTITDIAVGYQRRREERRLWDAQVQFSNLFNTTALYNFQSIFVGTRVAAPRAASVKLRYWW